MPTRIASCSCFNSASTAATTLAMRRCRDLPIRIFGAFLLAYAIQAGAGQIDIAGPAGSGSFGTSVTVLPNGNIVVTDPSGLGSSVGAVYLYSPTGVLISTLTGSTANDSVGSDGIKVLNNGNYVIVSTQWNNGGVAKVGAVTWGDAATGVSGVVSASNSLVGTTTGDQVGETGVTTLSNGNYVVVSRVWDNGGITNAGAATWANGSTGTSGTVSASNSLVGSTAHDQVGVNGVTALSNGNYVVGSPGWRNGAVASGAATWGDGSTGISGIISASNSLVSSTNGSDVGSGSITALNNGNYVVASPSWNNGAFPYVGAATWGNGSTGTSGVVSATNSLVGSTTSDLIGNFGIFALSNGNYVVASSDWNNGIVSNAGAATWGNGSTGTSGAVSATNSIVGTTADDQVGFSRGAITSLSNGNYVVTSGFWDNGGIVDAGAATWGDGSTGTSGAVSAANSLVGTSASDQVGRSSVTALSNGNYVVASKSWDNGVIINVGAATWGDGSAGTSGPVSPSNSLIGAKAGDEIGSDGVIALTNGNYVVASSNWDNGGVINVGAATWGNGSAATNGVVSPTNSLTGINVGDQVGRDRAIALTNGNYVVSSSLWNNGIATDTGAVTWGDGITGTTGAVSVTNSLTGTTSGDRVGDVSFGLAATALSDGNYAVSSKFWDSGAIIDAGAITLGNGERAFARDISSANSVLGTLASGGATMVFDYDAARKQLVVGRPASNIVTLFDDRVFQNGFE